MNESELQEEHHHIMETRLAILCGMDTPTAQQVALAMEEADKAIEQLRK
jgi:hypothetical protein